MKKTQRTLRDTLIEKGLLPKSGMINSNQLHGIRQFLNGKKLRLLINHGYGKAGSIITPTPLLGSCASPATTTISYLYGTTGPTISYTSLVLVNECQTKEEILIEMQELTKAHKKAVIEYKKEIESLDLKLKFLEEHGLDTYDEDEFKVYNALSILDNPKSTKLDKAKLIASLIKN